MKVCYNILKGLLIYGGITLKKPKFLIQVYSFIFMFIGPIFIVMGYLNKIGLLPTTRHSRDNPAVVFPIVGIIFLAVGLIFFFIAFYKEKRCKKLQITGIKLHGTVTKIKKLSYTKIRKKSPYIIYFTYEYAGDKYDGKSHLLWDKPDISEGDTIVVYIDEYKKDFYMVEV